MSHFQVRNGKELGVHQGLKYLSLLYKGWARTYKIELVVQTKSGWRGTAAPGGRAVLGWLYTDGRRKTLTRVFWEEMSQQTLPQQQATAAETPKAN